MWQSLVGHFLLALLSVVIMAALASWATIRFTNVDEPRVAAFALAIGYAIGTFQFHVAVGTEGLSQGDAVTMGRGVGALAGLWTFWWWLFRRNSSSPE